MVVGFSKVARLAASGCSDSSWDHIPIYHDVGCEPDPRSTSLSRPTASTTGPQSLDTAVDLKFEPQKNLPKTDPLGAAI